jgi:hypothetical protein
LVNFTGAVDVFVTYPSSKSAYQDVAGVIAQQSFGAITATSAALTSGTITTAPSNATDIVNKEYADSISSGLNYHQPVNYASTAALPTYTYNNGASGVGATITAVANGALSLGGGSPSATQRVLVKDEIGGNAAYNGVYTVTQAGTSLLPFILTRATDYDTSGSGTNEIDQGDYVLVISGTLASTAWVQQTPLPIVVGTTALTFLQFNAPITYYAGTGLNLSPATTFNITNVGTAGTYGSASAVPVLVTNAQGQVTSVTNTNIAIAGSAVSGNIAGSAGSVANALTLGTYLTGTSYNGSAAVTATVDATSANTASKVVARDVSGNFSAGTITAALTGNASTATAATNISGGAANQIPYQTGAATTVFIAAPTVAGTYLNWTGSAFAYSAISTPSSVTFNNGGTGDVSGTTFNGSVARTISYNTVGASPLAGSSSLTTTGTVTSGTWSASFGAVSGANLTSLTAGNLSGTIPSAVLGNSTVNIGTTAVALNRASANQALTGISSVTLPGATSGSAQITPNAVAGTGTVLTLPATTGTLALTSDITAAVNNGALTMNVSGTGLSGSASFTANQAGASTFTVTSNATNLNTASTIVARDASGNFTAGTITAALSGNASTATSATTAGSVTGQANSATITAATANTASTIVLRDASGNFSAGTITATLSGNASTATSATSATTAGSVTGQANSATITATSVNTANQIVLRDASGNFSAGTITAALNGNASTATSATTATTATNAGNATTAGGFTPSQTAGTANRIVVADANGYIFNNYFNSTDNSVASGVTGIMSKAGDNYYRTATAAAVATFISGQSMNIAGNATTATTATNQSGGTVSATTGNFSSTVSTSSVYTRNAAGTGYLSGNYSSVETTATSGAIYSIGGSYVPGTTTLGNMYGIGYGYSGNAGITATGAPGSLWGQYVASGGVSRIFFDADNGRGFFNGAIYSAGNTVLNAGNYNIYAPTLTGTGASGTWGINVTGSAGSASSATTATTATNLAGGSAGTIPYQSAAGTTVQLAAGTAGYVLQSNGTSAPSWVAASGGAQAGGVIYENSKTISSNYTLTASKNGMSVGPITVNSGVSVTVPSGQRWVIL